MTPLETILIDGHLGLLLVLGRLLGVTPLETILIDGHQKRKDKRHE